MRARSDFTPGAASIRSRECVSSPPVEGPPVSRSSYTDAACVSREHLLPPLTSHIGSLGSRVGESIPNGRIAPIIDMHRHPSE